MRVAHFTATLSPRDAVGAHTLAFDDLMREMGHDTTLYAASIHPDLRGRARDYRDHAQAPTADLLVYQTSTGSPGAPFTKLELLELSTFHLPSMFSCER